MPLRPIVINPLVFTLFAAVAVGAEPAMPIALHPANPHYFVWRDTPTILITSGEHYGALNGRRFSTAAGTSNSPHRASPTILPCVWFAKSEGTISEPHRPKKRALTGTPHVVIR
jgi:hypothetical protein